MRKNITIPKVAALPILNDGFEQTLLAFTVSFFFLVIVVVAVAMVSETVEIALDIVLQIYAQLEAPMVNEVDLRCKIMLGVQQLPETHVYGL